MEVGGAQHVEARRFPHQQRGGGVHQHFVERHLGEVARHSTHFAQEQAVAEDEIVGLVDCRHLAAPTLCQGERAAGDAAACRGADLAYRQGGIRVRHEFAAAGVHVAVGVEPLGVLAHDHQVERADRTGQPGPGARRTDVGVQVEPGAQCGRHVDAAPVAGGVAQVVDRAKDNAIGRARPLQSSLRQGGAMRRQGREADRHCFPFQVQRLAGGDRVQHRQGGVGNLGTDPVTG